MFVLYIYLQSSIINAATMLKNKKYPIVSSNGGNKDIVYNINSIINITVPINNTNNIPCPKSFNKLIIVFIFLFCYFSNWLVWVTKQH